MSSCESLTTFSVVIPLYNRSEKVARAIQSAQSQVLKPLDIIVVDDGSTDNGPELVRSKFPQVLLVCQPNSGPGSARNRGISEARGSWVAFLDSDDIWHPQHLLELARLVKAFPDAGLAFTKYVATPEPADEQAARGGRGVLSSIDYFRENTPAFTSSTAVCKQVAGNVGGFGSRMSGEDKEFWARVAMYYPVAMSTAVTAIYVDSEDGLSALAKRKGRSESSNLADYSFTLATVHRALEFSNDDLYASSESLRSFLNYRLSIKARASLMRGEIGTARMLARFLSRPYNFRTRTLVWILKLPHPALRLLVAIRRRIRRP